MLTKFLESRPRLTLLLACLLVLATYVTMIDLKGISTDEGMRLAIINGGFPYRPEGVAPGATWAKVLEINSANAYQPLYFLLLNTLMRLAGAQSDIFFRLVNIVFLLLCLGGLLALSRGWRLTSRLFLLGLFSFNAFLFMHVLQIREYTAGLAFYVWSTWLVLRLDTRQLARPWADVAWFSAYGVLLTLGFFVQSWVVFPSVAQGIFLIMRRAGDRLRFYAHLALSYTIVLSATLPYLRANQQKVNVGLWARENSSIWSHLSVGFHLLLSGHLPGRSPFTEFLFWFWLAAATGALGLIFLGRAGARRQAVLLLLCIGISLAFQVGYAWRIETLSLWPRYFVIHYFFLVWLIALGFATLDEMRAAPALPLARRRSLAGFAGVLAAIMTGSAVFQVHSYRSDPYLDTGVTRASDWRTMAAELSKILQSSDVVIVNDFIIRGTLTFTRPISNQVVLLSQMDDAEFRHAKRLLYLAPDRLKPGWAGVIARMSTLGFAHEQEIDLHSTDGTTVLNEWHVVIFSRN